MLKHLKKHLNNTFFSLFSEMSEKIIVNHVEMVLKTFEKVLETMLRRFNGLFW